VQVYSTHMVNATRMGLSTQNVTNRVPL